jgi:DNA replication and repair protein RecF
MYIQEIELKDFRNYENLHLPFSRYSNFIVGPNGAGKTNIIEAVSLLSNLRSFRNMHDTDMIRWGSDHYYCASSLAESHDTRFEIAYSIENNTHRRRVKVDDVPFRSSIDYYGKVLTTVFSPTDIQMVQGVPDVKRRFFDSVISKFDREYLIALSDFRKVLYNRNRLLKGMREKGRYKNDELDIWDTLFTEKSVFLMKMRREFISSFNDFFTISYRSISRENNPPVIRYKPSIDECEHDRIESILRKNRSRDISYGSTSMGPQRDDYQFLVGDRLFVNFASQGQRRTAAISLKIAENNFVENHMDQRCIILIDDIFSELDSDRQRNMIEFLNKGNQVIFTMVNTNTLVDYKNSESLCYSIDLTGTISAE